MTSCRQKRTGSSQHQTSICSQDVSSFILLELSKSFCREALGLVKSSITYNEKKKRIFKSSAENCPYPALRLQTEEEARNKAQ